MYLFLLLLLLFLAVLGFGDTQGLHCGTQAFSRSCEWASHCGGFSCGRPQVQAQWLLCIGSRLCHTCLVTQQQVGSYFPGQRSIEPCIPCIRRQTLNQGSPGPCILNPFLLLPVPVCTPTGRGKILQDLAPVWGLRCIFLSLLKYEANIYTQETHDLKEAAEKYF